MIAYLRGKIAEKQPAFIIVEVQGVGYKAGISLQTYERLPAVGADIKLYIYHHITENSQSFFGFFDKAEQELFEMLITVKSIGPKLGLTILSGLQAQDLMQAIAGQDVMRLSKIPGIGKKTAERMVLELKDKIGSANQTGTGVSFESNDVRSEAISALEALGYKRASAEKAVQTVYPALQEGGRDVSALIKAALKALM